MTNDQSPWRRRLARTLLGLGAISQLALLDAWRRHGAIPGATRSTILLVLLLVVSVFSAIALRRLPRPAVTALAVGAIYAAVLMTWTLYLACSQATRAHRRMELPVILDFALTVGIPATIPLALLVAWPLRSRATERRS